MKLKFNDFSFGGNFHKEIACDVVTDEDVIAVRDIIQDEMNNKSK